MQDLGCSQGFGQKIPQHRLAKYNVRVIQSGTQVAKDGWQVDKDERLAPFHQ